MTHGHFSVALVMNMSAVQSCCAVRRMPRFVPLVERSLINLSGG